MTTIVKQEQEQLIQRFASDVINRCYCRLSALEVDFPVIPVLSLALSALKACPKCSTPRSPRAERTCDDCNYLDSLEDHWHEIYQDQLKALQKKFSVLDLEDLVQRVSAQEEVAAKKRAYANVAAELLQYAVSREESPLVINGISVDREKALRISTYMEDECPTCRTPWLLSRESECETCKIVNGLVQRAESRDDRTDI